METNQYTALSARQKFILWILSLSLLLVATIGGYAYGSWKAFVQAPIQTVEFAVDGSLAVETDNGIIEIDGVEGRLDTSLPTWLFSFLALND